MINFAEGWSPSETKYKITKSDLKKLVKKLMEVEEEYPEASYTGGLNPSHITEILKHILYVQKFASVDLRVQVEDDGYHLGVLIAKKNLDLEDD